MYKIEIEIYEGKGGELEQDELGIIYPDVVKEGICPWMYRGDGDKSYQQGQRFNYPEDWGKLCPWLASSLDPIIQTLRFGGTLGWQYDDTPYEKEIDPDGVTTEFIRCVDPTESGIVVKVIRTKLQYPDEN
jgi:uncharacterized repeat protein (TIGR04076 family)